MFKTEIGALVLRVTLGIIFFFHGLAKFQGGIENIAGWFDSIGLPGPMAYAVAGVELIGGIALILGLGTKAVSGLFALLMLGATLKVKLSAGLLGNGEAAGYELDLALFAIAIFLVINGSKLLSIDSLIFGKKEEQITM
ncbi:DoxX family protein [Bacillus massilinigeriensis]|uniref:DoxX family protein n=1 Tax=Bacillus mediterraneensis TaxID=1805474 RepID=UPI0008F960A8|nr:DoxX family protein [Bacillus mediterraneensis]